MKDALVVKRYADAFLSYAKKTCGLDRAFADFKRTKDIMRETPEFMEFLLAPDIPLIDKHVLIDRALGGDFTKEFCDFLKLLLEHKRIEKLFDIAEWVRVEHSHGEEVEALLKSAYPLDLEVVQQIKDKLETRLGKKLKLYIDLDATILGGIQVTIGNTVIDGSLRRRLDDLREKLSLVRV